VWATKNPHFDKQIGVNMNETAFPAQALGGLGYTTGMTLRDYFAAKAMQAIITNHKLEDCDDNVVAANAYQLADFMLEARGE
jgi:hypothetical protein